MNSVAMDALKYSGYMGSLYSSASSDQAAIKSMYSSPDTQPQPSAASGAGAGPGAGQEGGVTKTEYSADSLSRSYLEQQRAYYESAGLKAGGGYPGAVAGSYGGAGAGQEAKSGGYTPDSSGRQSVESPDLKKSASLTPDPAQALQVGHILQASLL